MALFKQKTSENWWISVYRKGQPRKYVPTGTPDREKAEAIEKLVLSSYRGNLERDRLIAALDSLMGWDAVDGLPISELWSTYLKTKPRAGEHTINQRRLICEKLVAYLADHHPATLMLNEVTPQHAQAFSDWVLNEKGGAGKTHNNRMSNIATVFGAIVVRANLRNNPFGFLEKLDESDSRSGRPFSADEQRRIFERCAVVGNDWLAICTLAKYSGLRLIDMAFLAWDQVEDDVIDLTPSKTKRHGIKVRIPLHPNVRKELRLLGRKGDYVFPVLAERYSTTSPKSQFMEEIIRPLGIDMDGAKVSFHCWRHTFRTMLAAAKVPQEVAMKLGGWTNQSTAEVYNHDFTQLEAAIGGLE